MNHSLKNPRVISLESHQMDPCKILNVRNYSMLRLSTLLPNTLLVVLRCMLACTLKYIIVFEELFETLTN